VASARARARYPIPNSCWAAFPPLPVAPPDEDRACGAAGAAPPEAGGALEVNSPDLAEATRALGSLCEEEEEEEEEEDVDEAPASACSGPNSRFALAAAGRSVVVASLRVELEDAPRCGALSTGTSWAFATDELRAP